MNPAQGQPPAHATPDGLAQTPPCKTEAEAVCAAETARATTTSSLSLDGQSIPLQPGDTVLQAARRAGHYIPHLCWHPDHAPGGSCRLCAVEVDGRPQPACTTAARAGSSVSCRSPALDNERRTLLQMLFVEGNHFCPSCEKSGNCLLQATAYQMGMTHPRFEEFFPDRPLDLSHPDVWIDHNRCIACGLCVRASADADGKHVFALGGHGSGTHLVIDSPSGQLGDSALTVTDQAAHICPVGAIVPKRVGFAVPIGERRYDRHTAADPDAQEAS